MSYKVTLYFLAKQYKLMMILYFILINNEYITSLVILIVK